MKTATLILRNTGLASSEDDFSILRKYSTVYSEIYIVKKRGDDAHPSRMVIKLCRTKTSNEVVAEFDALSRFNALFKDGRISVPKPLAVDPSSKAIVMEHVDGESLKMLLLRLGSSRRGSVLKTIELAAEALAKFHRTSIDVTERKHSINSPFLHKNLELAQIGTLLDSCNFDFRIRSFIDFSAWNIIIEDDLGERISLIDFPDNDCVSSPHIDLARFKYSLDIINQHPQFRLRGLRWWDPNDLQDRFLSKYSSEMGASANDQDKLVIEWFERQYLRKLQKVYENGNSGIRLRLEGIYMRRFISSSLKEK